MYLLSTICDAALPCRLYLSLKELLMSAVNLLLVQLVLWLAIKFGLIAQGLNLPCLFFLFLIILWMHQQETHTSGLISLDAIKLLYLITLFQTLSPHMHTYYRNYHMHIYYRNYHLFSRFNWNIKLGFLIRKNSVNMSIHVLLLLLKSV